MKCELCNGKGVINDADTLYGVRYCPQCDAGNLQLRLDHKFLPVVDDVPERKPLTQEQIEAADEEALQAMHRDRQRGRKPRGYCEEFTRAIERRHGIGPAAGTTEGDNANLPGSNT